jgi:imidazole glycerol phosphate synthase subunit HisF
VGDPIVAVKIFNDKGTDELILLEIGEKPLDDQRLEELKGIATEAFMPISYGGGIRTIEHNGGLDAFLIGTPDRRYPQESRRASSRRVR